jgi:SPP1 family predicted phage head-tail adaptor
MARKTPIDAGERDRQVTLQELTESVGTSRFPVEAWSTLATVFARREDIGGRERFTMNQTSAPFDCKWEIPYLTDMDPDEIDVPKKRRLVYKSRTYDIVAAAMIGRYEGIELLTLARNG